MSTDVMERMRAAFQAEAQELLGELDSALLVLETDPTQEELVHRVFRAIHTIKGSGATAGFRHLAAVAHQVEEAFDLARSGKLPITGELVDCALKACDVFREILAADDPDAECHGEAEVRRALAVILQKPAPQDDAKAERAADDTARAAFEIVFRPHRGLFYSGTDPVTLLDELRGLGPAHITGHSDGVPLFFDLEPESCYLWWDIKLVTNRGEDAIREVFAFVEDECDLSIRLLEDQSSSVALLGTVPTDVLELFATECQEHLDAVEREALDLEKNPGSLERVNALFRTIHSIKGNAGVLLGHLLEMKIAENHPLSLFSRVAHAVESLLETLREPGAEPVPPSAVSTVLEARDALQALLENIACHSATCIVPSALLDQLGLGEPAKVDAAESAGAAAFRNTAKQCLDVLDQCLHHLEQGKAAESVLKTYKRSLKTLASAAAYQKRSDLNEPIAIQLQILSAAMTAGDAVSHHDRAKLSGSLKLTRQRIEGSPADETTEEKPKEAVPAVKPSAPAGSSSIRIDQEKLDRLMRVVGELLVARGAFPTLVGRLLDGEDPGTVARGLKEAGSGISRIAEELQASVMAIRMLPVKTVFQRFPRLVRDLARSLGKDVQLVVEGETIELDKTILEQIGDPLVHLIRNSVDHGVELPEVRQRSGKPASGRVTLRASSEAGNVVIEVEDNGRGLDAAALKRKAVEKGLLTAEAANALSYAEACRLVFLPGLSTAAQVTDVSGRGVGMDVVQNNIRTLQGSIDIRSTPGEGTVFTIKLPTSLIISKGILLEAGGQEYILPLTSIRDMVKVPAAEIHNYRNTRITQVRGEVYSLFSLASLFGLPDRAPEEVPIAIIETGKVRYGLIADRFVSEVEVLVKPLSGGLEGCREFHGAAIMGDGRVVLVLNPVECHRLEVAASQVAASQVPASQ